jgi:hypothetical protein
MTKPTIMHQRLYHQQIEHPRLPDVAAVASWLGAVQGQDYPGAKWSLGLRLPGSTDAQIEQAIADKIIVRTWVMRGTLHLMAAADVRWLVDLVGPRLIAGGARRYRELELDEATLTRSADILVNALAGDKQLDRRALLAILEQQGISTAGQRGIHMLSHASLQGLILQGVTYNNNPTFTRMDEALPDTLTLPRDEALAELARRYFTSRGPATFQDFVHWSGLLTRDARAGLAVAKDHLVEDKIDGESYWLSPNTPPTPKPSPTAYALPGFDEYILGYKNRDAMLDPQHAEKICPGRNGVFYPTMVIDGRVVGTWKRAFKKRSIIVTPAPFDALAADEREAFVQAVQRYGEFHQLPIELTPEE